MRVPERQSHGSAEQNEATLSSDNTSIGQCRGVDTRPEFLYECERIVFTLVRAILGFADDFEATDVILKDCQTACKLETPFWNIAPAR